MSYQRFRSVDSFSFASAPSPAEGNVASVATVAGVSAIADGEKAAGRLPGRPNQLSEAWNRARDAISVDTPATVATFATLPTSDDGRLDERAAIIEFDGVAPRSWAEGFARLDLSHPIPGFTGADWRRFIDDGGRFLNRWAPVAASLGWTAEDVFGLNPAAPAARYDGMGLVALIRGGDVIDVRPDRATIRMNSGSCLTYYLRRPRPGAVAVWELL